MAGIDCMQDGGGRESVITTTHCSVMRATSAGERLYPGLNRQVWWHVASSPALTVYFPQSPPQGRTRTHLGPLEIVNNKTRKRYRTALQKSLTDTRFRPPHTPHFPCFNHLASQRRVEGKPNMFISPRSRTSLLRRREPLPATASGNCPALLFHETVSVVYPIPQI